MVDVTVNVVVVGAPVTVVVVGATACVVVLVEVMTEAVDDADPLSRSIGFSSRATDEPSGTSCVTPPRSWYSVNWLGGV